MSAFVWPASEGWTRLFDVDLAGGSGALVEYDTFAAGGLVWRVTTQGGAAKITRTADALVMERNSADGVASVSTLLADTVLGRAVTARDVFSIALHGGIVAAGSSNMLAMVQERADANTTRLGRGHAGGVRNNFGISSSVQSYNASGAGVFAIPWGPVAAGSTLDPFAARVAISFQHGAACVALAGATPPGRLLTAAQRATGDASGAFQEQSTTKVNATCVGVRAFCPTGAVIRVRRLVVDHMVLPE